MKQKTARLLSIFFHPLFHSFYNFLFLLLLAPLKGAVLGFDITLFFLCIVVIPMFYTAAVVYNDNKEFSWAYLSDMALISRKKLLIYTVIYNLTVLLVVINLNPVFFESYKPVFASLIMGYAFCMMMSFLLHLLNHKNSLHALTVSFFMAFGFLFTQWLPVQGIPVPDQGTWFFGMGFANLAVLAAVIWARLFTGAHTAKEIVMGLAVGIISPVLLTLLTYGI